MRAVLILLICLHGVIHLFGFLKAFGISEFKGINQPIAKLSGLFWLLTFLLFVTTVLLLIKRSDLWWAFGMVTVGISQVLIFTFWSDAKYGTIANLIIFISAISSYVKNDFENLIRQERTEMFENSVNDNTKVISSNNLSNLPTVIKKWLNYNGAVGKPIVSSVYLTQEVQLKLKPEQDEWYKGTAEQYVTVAPPAFNWDINTRMNPLMSVVGRDKFENGKAEMLIKLFSFIPVVNVKNHEKVNQSTLQRYLAEIVWFPSAAISNYVQWEEINEKSARATMEYKGIRGTGVFHFDEEGQFKRFAAMRFKDPNDNEPMEWTVVANKTDERNDVKIPVECEVRWNLKSGQWTWLKLKIKHIEYDVKKVPVFNNAYK